MRGKLNDIMGRLLLALAVTLHRQVASREARRRLLQRRNSALRSAYRRGVPVEVLAARTGLTQSWVRCVVQDPKKTAVEEAA